MSDKKQGHDFSAGQKVRCIDAANVHRLGTIYTVADLRPGGMLSLLECGGLWSAARFEAVEEDHALEVGQKVRCTNAEVSHLTCGMIYTITEAGEQVTLAETCGTWNSARFEPVEEEIDENAKEIKDALDDLKVAFAKYWPELQAMREEIKDLEDSRDIQAETFDEIREHLRGLEGLRSGNVADCVKDALDYLVGRRDYWEEQAKIARARGDHKSDRISDLLRERDSLKEEITGLRERTSKQFQDTQRTMEEYQIEIAELESIILNQGLNKKADLIRERDSLRDEVETKDAIIAKQDESIRCLKAKHFDKIDEALRLRERLDHLKARTVDTESAQRLVDMWKDRADKAEAKLEAIKDGTVALNDLLK